MQNKVLLTFIGFIATLTLVWSAHAANSRVEFASPLESPLAEPNPGEQPADSWGITAVEDSNHVSIAPSYENSVEGKIAVTYYAQKHNVDIAQLFMGQSGIVTLPETEKKLWQAKVGVLTTDIEMREVITIDMESGQVIDFEAAKSAEEQAYRERYGKLDPDLHQALLEAEDDELFAINVWYRAKRVNQTILEPILWWITEQGYEVTYISKYAPTFSSIMSKQAIRALEMREDIDSISLEDTYHPTGFNSFP